MASRTEETPYEGRDERVRSVGKKWLSKMKMALRRGDQTKRMSMLSMTAHIPDSAAEPPADPTITPAARYATSTLLFAMRGLENKT